jgi:hypothetical protein
LGLFGFFYGEHMAITVPETEPLSFYSGETVKWKRTDLADYPAPTWTLSYFLQKSGTKIDFASSQDGSTTGHLISLTPAATLQMKRILFPVLNFTKITNLGLKKTKSGYQ